jgi:hypothetical protein
LLGLNEENSTPPDLEAAKEYFENGKLLVDSKIKMDPSLRESLGEFLQVFEEALTCIAQGGPKPAGQSFLNAFSNANAGASAMNEEEEEEEDGDRMES